MIAYEDLEKALARWKGRRSGAGESAAAGGEGNARGMVVETVTSFQVRESSGEVDLVDAVLDES